MLLEMFAFGRSLKIFLFFCNSQKTFSYLELRLISVDVWFEKWGISLGWYPRISPSFCWRMFSHCDAFRLVAREQKYFMNHKCTCRPFFPFFSIRTLISIKDQHLFSCYRLISSAHCRARLRWPLRLTWYTSSAWYQTVFHVILLARFNKISLWQEACRILQTAAKISRRRLCVD